MPGEGLTHGPPAKQKAGGSHHRISRIIRHSLRDGVTAYTCSPRGPGFLAPVIVPTSSARLSLSVGRPGRHDFTVRERAFVSRTLTSTASRAPRSWRRV